MGQACMGYPWRSFVKKNNRLLAVYTKKQGTMMLPISKSDDIYDRFVVQIIRQSDANDV